MMLTGLYGGTFDPIHQGHIAPVQSAAQALGLSQLYLVPCHVSPHKTQTVANDAQRRAMVERVCEDEPFFVLDDRELGRHGPSYTVDTLTEYRQEIGPDAPLAFFMGMDSFNQFHRWYRYQRIMELAHMVVCLRGGHPPQWNAPITRLLERAEAHTTEALTQSAAGRIWLASTPLIDCSSTQLRQQLANGERPNAIPRAVLDYIEQERLYRPSVSTAKN